MGSLGAAAEGSVDAMGASYQYRTSKAALNMAMPVLSKELAPRGISVATISPGWVKTDMGGANAADYAASQCSLASGKLLRSIRHGDLREILEL